VIYPFYKLINQSALSDSKPLVRLSVTAFYAICFDILLLGTSAFIDKNKELLKLDSTSEGASSDVCNKDTGGNQKCLQKWSRGLLHFVRGGGHIESWSPLYL